MARGVNSTIGMIILILLIFFMSMSGKTKSGFMSLGQNKILSLGQNSGYYDIIGGDDASNCANSKQRKIKFIRDDGSMRIITFDIYPQSTNEPREIRNIAIRRFAVIKSENNLMRLVGPANIIDFSAIPGKNVIVGRVVGNSSGRTAYEFASFAHRDDENTRQLATLRDPHGIYRVYRGQVYDLRSQTDMAMLAAEYRGVNTDEKNKSLFFCMNSDKMQ